MLRAFKECDFFRKLPPEHRAAEHAPSLAGQVLRALSLLAILSLAAMEIQRFLSPESRQSFSLDMLTTLDASAPRKMRVLLNITVHDFPCVDLSLDYQDVMGARSVDVRSTVFKQRLYQNGSLVETPAVNNDPKVAEAMLGGTGPSISPNATGNVSCGTCYGALPEGQCCNTCADVLFAYRLKRWALPRIESIEQCKNDGTARSAYQPPQIMRLSDYSSEDYIPTFTRFGAMTGSGSEARIGTPFKFNMTHENTGPLTFAPLNLTAIMSSLGGNEGLLWDDEDDLVDRNDASNSTGKLKPWPFCIRRNVVVHGLDMGEALMTDLRKYGANFGCWDDACERTDKFQCASMDECSQVCHKIEECKWWSFGMENGMMKCWLRTNRHDRQRKYGFSSGSRLCSPGNGSPAPSSTTVTTVPPSSTSPHAGDGANRRLSSLGLGESEFPFGLSFGRSFMPMFGAESDESRMRREQKGESCRLHGYFDTNKVPGNFHIGTHGANSPSYLSYFTTPSAQSQNMRHTINSLTFVEVETQEVLNRTQPLDGFESPKAFTFQYYLMVTPATVRGDRGEERHGYQFRAGSFVTNELVGPAVFFRLDIDPIRVTYHTEEVTWTRLFVNLCAIVGGCFAITTYLGQLRESASAIALHRD